MLGHLWLSLKPFRSDEIQSSFRPSARLGSSSWHWKMLRDALNFSSGSVESTQCQYPPLESSFWRQKTQCLKRYRCHQQQSRTQRWQPNQLETSIDFINQLCPDLMWINNKSRIKVNIKWMEYKWMVKWIMNWMCAASALLWASPP